MRHTVRHAHLCQVSWFTYTDIKIRLHYLFVALRRKGLHQARVDDIRENLQAVSASAGMAYELQNGDDHEAYKFESPLVYFGQKEYEAAVEFDVVKKKYCVPYPVKKILTELKESEEVSVWCTHRECKFICCLYVRIASASDALHARPAHRRLHLRVAAQV